MFPTEIQYRVVKDFAYGEDRWTVRTKFDTTDGGDWVMWEGDNRPTDEEVGVVLNLMYRTIHFYVQSIRPPSQHIRTVKIEGEEIDE